MQAISIIGVFIALLVIFRLREQIYFKAWSHGFQIS